MENEKQKNIKGIKIRTANRTMIFLSCVLYILIIYVTIQVSFRYDELISTTEDYIACEKNAALVREGSDYLTEEVRLYVVTFDLQHVEAYLEEVNVTKRREMALDELGKFSFSDKAAEYLEAALSNSNHLVTRELYAMRLISEANEYDVELLPEEVFYTRLTEEDKALPKEEMLRKAQNMVFDETYQEAKALIMNDISLFLDDIVEETGERQSGNADALERMLSKQRIYISILFILNLLVFLLDIVLILRPLQLSINCIKEGKLMQVAGAYEFQYLAQIYNDMLEVSMANEELLRYKAEHDSLTGIANRESFDRMRELLKSASKPVALLLIDVDEFKKINDSYGHSTGDQVLQNVANLLKEQFRSDDCPARIGGDEFAVIMTDITSDLKAVIIHKLHMIIETLQNPEEGIPKVTLSIGVAFSTQGMSVDLYKETDRALYYVKEHGRNGYKFYDEL